MARVFAAGPEMPIWPSSGPLSTPSGPLGTPSGPLGQGRPAETGEAAGIGTEAVRTGSKAGPEGSPVSQTVTDTAVPAQRKTSLPELGGTALYHMGYYTRLDYRLDYRRDYRLD